MSQWPHDVTKKPSTGLGKGETISHSAFHGLLGNENQTFWHLACSYIVVVLLLSIDYENTMTEDFYEFSKSLLIIMAPIYIW